MVHAEGQYAPVAVNTCRENSHVGPFVEAASVRVTAAGVTAAGVTSAGVASAGVASADGASAAGTSAEEVSVDSTCTLGWATWVGSETRPVASRLACSTTSGYHPAADMAAAGPPSVAVTFGPWVASSYGRACI